MADTFSIQITDKLSSPNPTGSQPTIFAHLKSKIFSNALALYGTSQSSPNPAFDIITYTIPLPAGLQILINGRADIPSTLYGVALIAYASPGEFTSWERLATAENSGGIIAAMQELLVDVQEGMGRVMLRLNGGEETQAVRRGRAFVVEHRVVPDVAQAGGETLPPSNDRDAYTENHDDGI